MFRPLSVCLLSLLYAYSLAQSAILDRTERRVFDVYWNSTNELFEPFSSAIDTPGYMEIVVHKGDILKFHCPKRKGEKKELLMVYKVSRSDFESCFLSSSASLIVECASLHSTVTLRHTIKEEDGDEMYYISTSDGFQSGIHNKQFGLCLEKNMRMAVTVGKKSLRRIPLYEGSISVGETPLMEHEKFGKLELKEENGVLSWKKTIPRMPFNNEELLKFEKSRQVEPLLIDDEKVNKMEEKVHHRSGVDVMLPPDVFIFNDKSAKIEKNSSERHDTLFMISLLLTFILKIF